MDQKKAGDTCPENQWQCPQCKLISTDRFQLRCPRCNKSLLPACSCSGNCLGCAGKELKP